MSDARAQLATFIQRREARWNEELRATDDGAIILREIASSISSNRDETKWQRRPSISDDGTTPIVLSWKAGPSFDDSLRLLVEPGCLAMTVAQQISFSLARIDRLLSLLAWRAAIPDINTITTQVFPKNHAATDGWRGGIWLGASVKPPGKHPCSQTDLRLYLNFGPGEPATRWTRVDTLFSSLMTVAAGSNLAARFATIQRLTIPVGLGLVISDGQLKALRLYVDVPDPTPSHLSDLTTFGSPPLAELQDTHDGYTRLFGPMLPHGVTVGYDFLRNERGEFLPAIERTKLDICCLFIAPEQRPKLRHLISALLARWSIDPAPFADFVRDVHEIWSGSLIQFVSLGISPGFQHATVYVQPRG